MVGIIVVVGFAIGGVRGTQLKIFHPMIKYKDLFDFVVVAPGLSGSVILLMGIQYLEVSPWVFKILCDKAGAMPEVKFCNNYIEMQTHFIQE